MSTSGMGQGPEDPQRTKMIEEKLKQLENEPKRQQKEERQRTKKLEEKLRKKNPEDQQTTNDD